MSDPAPAPPVSVPPPTAVVSSCTGNEQSDLGFSRVGTAYLRIGWPLTLILRFAFGTLGLHRVFLQVNVTNQPAISLYRRLGFVEEGTLRAAAFLDGRFVDRLLLSMLSHEFRQSPE